MLASGHDYQEEPDVWITQGRAPNGAAHRTARLPPQVTAHGEWSHPLGPLSHVPGEPGARMASKCPAGVPAPGWPGAAVGAARQQVGRPLTLEGARAGWRQMHLLVLPLLTWLIQLLNTALYWATMSNGRAGRDLG